MRTSRTTSFLCGLLFTLASGSAHAWDKIALPGFSIPLKDGVQTALVGTSDPEQADVYLRAAHIKALRDPESHQVVTRVMLNHYGKGTINELQEFLVTIAVEDPIEPGKTAYFVVEAHSDNVPILVATCAMTGLRYSFSKTKHTANDLEDDVTTIHNRQVLLRLHVEKDNETATSFSNASDTRVFFFTPQGDVKSIRVKTGGSGETQPFNETRDEFSVDSFSSLHTSLKLLNFKPEHWERMRGVQTALSLK